MDKHTERIDTKTSPKVKQMLYDIARKDSRSITKEIEHLIKQRYEELTTQGKGGK